MNQIETPPAFVKYDKLINKREHRIESHGKARVKWERLANLPDGRWPHVRRITTDVRTARESLSDEVARLESERAAPLRGVEILSSRTRKREPWHRLRLKLVAKRQRSQLALAASEFKEFKERRSELELERAELKRAELKHARMAKGWRRLALELLPKQRWAAIGLAVEKAFVRGSVAQGNHQARDDEGKGLYSGAAAVPPTYLERARPKANRHQQASRAAFLGRGPAAIAARAAREQPPAAPDLAERLESVTRCTAERAKRTGALERAAGAYQAAEARAVAQARPRKKPLGDERGERQGLDRLMDLHVLSLEQAPGAGLERRLIESPAGGGRDSSQKPAAKLACRLHGYPDGKRRGSSQKEAAEQIPAILKHYQKGGCGFNTRGKTPEDWLLPAVPRSELVNADLDSLSYLSSAQVGELRESCRANHGSLPPSTLRALGLLQVERKRAEGLKPHQLEARISYVKQRADVAAPGWKVRVLESVLAAQQAK